MSLYYEGYREAVRSICKYNLEELLAYIDGMQGRDNISDETDIEQVKSEALRQCREDFTDKSSPEYETVNFWTKVYQTSR